MKKYIIILFVFLGIPSANSQNYSALAMSEILANKVRFNPADQRQLENIKSLKPTHLIQELITDGQKNAFWLNIYNSAMLIHLRDTNFQGVYYNFYKKKNIIIAGKAFSLFEIEHEFLLGGKKMKKMGFKKSRLDTTWLKLRPDSVDLRVIFCMYRGLYGYPPFQIIENAQIQPAYEVSLTYFKQKDDKDFYIWDWVNKYKKISPDLEKKVFKTDSKIIYKPTPEAVFIQNFYPKYEGVKFKEEEKNPWLK